MDIGNIFGWIGSLFGASQDETSVKVSVPFGGPDPNAPDQPKDIPDDVAQRGWSKSIADCHERIKRAYPLVKAEWEQVHPGWTIKCDYTYRSPEFQFELFKKGRALQNGQWVVVDKSQVVTEKDGKKPSHHNVYPAQAADVYIVNATGKIIWSDQELYTELGQIWVKRGLVSGATWKYNWKDWDHVQVDYPIV